MKSGSQTRRARGRRASDGRSDSFTLGEVAAAVGGRLFGEPSLRLSGVQTLDRATPADLSWVADAHRVRQVRESGAGALLVATEEGAGGRPAVLVATPTLALATWLAIWRPARRPPPGVSKRAYVDPSARLGHRVSIAPGATVAKRARIGARTVLYGGAFVGEEAEIGEDCVLHPNAVVLERCRVGSRCVLHAGAVVGSDGFGYVWDGREHRKIPQLGAVRIEDDVEIGANASIDRATLGETVIGRGTKIDNLVQVGHNVVVEEYCILCGQAGIAGSSRLGKRVTLAGQVGISDHVTVGEGAVVTGQAGIVRGGSVPAGAVVSGMPAAPHREFLRRTALTARLPEFVRRLEELEKMARPWEKGEKPWKSGSPKS